MASRHRSDVTFDDLTLLARFARALVKVPVKFYSPMYVLGEVDMLLPFWVLTGNGWEVAFYRVVTQEAIGITRNGFLHVCRNYLHEPPGNIIKLLNKLSMLAVIPGTEVGEEPQFRQPFFGVVSDYAEMPEADSMMKYVKGGFIIEKRRIVGGFR